MSAPKPVGTDFQLTGEALPEETVERAKIAGAVLFGACSSPSYRVEGYASPIVSLRKRMETFANLRPTRFLPVPTAREGVNLVVVRENTEDLYIGDEQTADAGDTGTATKRITRRATERIAHTAFRLARNEKAPPRHHRAQRQCPAADRRLVPPRRLRSFGRLQRYRNR